MRPPAPTASSPLRAPLVALCVPTTLALLAAWPVLVLGSLVPVVGLVAFPTLLSCTASLFLLLPATLHLLLAAPLPSPSPSRRSHLPRLPRLRLLSPLSNLHLLHLSLLVAWDLWTSSLVALAGETLTKRVLLLGGRDSATVVRENIPFVQARAGGDGAYGESLRLDVYLPQAQTRGRRPDHTHDDDDEEEDAAALAPVVLLLPSPSYRLLSLSRLFPSPLIALRLARLGALVVVPSLSPSPSAGGSGVARAVGEVRAALEWTAEHARAYGGDAERTSLVGYGAGAHVGLLALVQSAVVSARETLLREEKEQEQEHEQEQGPERARPSLDDDDAGASGAGTPLHEASSRARDTTAARMTHVAASPGAARSETDGGESERESRTRLGGEASPPRRAFSGRSGPDSSSSSSSSASSSTSSDTDLATLIRRPSAARPSARDIPSGVRACPLWTLSDPDSSSSEPEHRGESLSRFELPRGRGALRVTGVVLVAGVYDVVKQERWEEGWGAGEVSGLKRFCHEEERDILQACPSHLLYAASPLLSLCPASLLPLLPRRFLLIHGGRDPLVPFSQSTLLRTLLVGLGIDEVRLRLCRDEGALGALATLMHPTRYSPLVMREMEHVVCDPVPASASPGGKRKKREGAEAEVRRQGRRSERGVR